MPSLIVLALIGLAAQMVDGSLGMAYGVTSSTLLIAWGVSPAMASGSVHVAEMGTTLLSGFSHWRFGNVDWAVVLKLGVPGAAGAFLGASALANLSTEVARPFMSGLLLALGALLLFRFAFWGIDPTRAPGRFRTRFLAPLGLIGGFVDATGGGGWGPIATPTLLITGKAAVNKVVGSVSASEFLVSTAASIGFLLNLGSEGVSWSIAGALLAGGAIAAPFAAWLVSHVAPRILGTAVGGLIVTTNARILLTQFGVEDGARQTAYGLIALCWVGAVTVATRAVRRQRRLEQESVRVTTG